MRLGPRTDKRHARMRASSSVASTCGRMTRWIGASHPRTGPGHLAPPPIHSWQAARFRRTHVPMGLDRSTPQAERSSSRQSCSAVWRVVLRDGMGRQPTRLTRECYATPAFVREALVEAGLMQAYRERPPYQQNDYVGWITRAKREATTARRLAQMLDELRGRRQVHENGLSRKEGAVVSRYRGGATMPRSQVLKTGSSNRSTVRSRCSPTCRLHRRGTCCSPAVRPGSC